MFITGDEKIKTRGKRRQFDSVTDTGTEREKAQGYIDRLVRREADFTVDVNMAARKIQRAKEAENRSAKKQKLAEKGEFIFYFLFRVRAIRLTCFVYRRGFVGQGGWETREERRGAQGEGHERQEGQEVMVSALTISQWRNVLIVYACVPVLIVYRIRDDFKYDFRDHNKMGLRAFGPASTCQSVSVIRVYPEEPPYLCISSQVLDRVCG